MLADVALKARRIGLDLLEHRRQAGEAERAAGAPGLLEHGDGVAVGDQRGVGEPGRARADHRDALALRRLGVGEHGFAAGRAVDHAARCRRRCACRRRRCCRRGSGGSARRGAACRPIADRRPACGRARRNRPCRSRPPPSPSPDRRAGRPRSPARRSPSSRRRRSRGTSRPGPPSAGSCDAPSGLRAVVAGGDMQRVGAGLRRPDRDRLALVVGQPAVEIILDRQPVDHAERRAPRPSPRAARRGRSARGSPASRRIRRCGGSRTARGIARSGSRARRGFRRSRSRPRCARLRGGDVVRRGLRDALPASSPRERSSRASSHRPDAEWPTAPPAARRRCRRGCGRRRGRAGSRPWRRRDGFRSTSRVRPGMKPSS